MFRLFIVLAIGIALLQIVTAAQSTQEVIDVSLCDLRASPDRFDNKTIRLHAFLSREFEDSTLHDPGCPDEALLNRRVANETIWVWADFGDEAKWERVTGYVPLVDDDRLRAFRTLLSERMRAGQMTSATMVGTFYAGRPLEGAKSTTRLRGYGHMGCCTLFVISQVESFELNYDEQLDYSRQSLFDLSLSPGCNYVRILSVPDNSEIRLSQ